MTDAEPDQTPVEGGQRPPEPPARSPLVWVGVLVCVAALVPLGLNRMYPFDPGGWLGHWYVEALASVTGIGGTLLGVWLVGRGYRGRNRPES
ncbi:hypothetical protein [Plantactinospora sp. CA-290183]|uniref:hypothetical protein n=1 Tax=Plantactinospora sp. CA-290183 TaxID=3240006 RepID=UPI003D8F1FA7